jgi:hypothetical protein
MRIGNLSISQVNNGIIWMKMESHTLKFLGELFFPPVKFFTSGFPVVGWRALSLISRRLFNALYEKAWLAILTNIQYKPRCLLPPPGQHH